MTQKHLGFCPCCRGDFRLHKRTLVHHGYKRPGDGYIHGDCFGVGKAPHELTNETAKMWLEYLRQVRVMRVNAVARIPELTQLSGRYPGATPVVKATCRPEVWEAAIRSHRNNLEGEIRMIDGDLAETQHLIDTWTLLPLRLVADVEDHERACRELTKQVKQKEREMKAEHDAWKRANRMVSRIKNLTKDVDRWVKKNEPAKLGDLYYEIVRNLPDVCERRFKPEEILPWFDRDDVWRGLGLLDENGYVLPARDAEWDPKTRKWVRQPGDSEQDQRFYDLTIRRKNLR